MIGTLAVDGWGVTFGTTRRGLGGADKKTPVAPGCRQRTRGTVRQVDPSGRHHHWTKDRPMRNAAINWETGYLHVVMCKKLGPIGQV